MGTIAEKLQYLSDSVNDIQAAIIEKGVAVGSDVPLGSYGAKIRSIQTGSDDTEDITAEWFIAKAVSDVTSSVVITKRTYTSL